MAEKQKGSELTRPSFWDLSWPELGAWPRIGRLERLLGGLEDELPRGALSPSVDVHEEDGSYQLSFELPGVKPEDVAVELAEGTLSIRGEKRDEREEQRGTARYRERRYGSFQRSFRLPQDADPDGVEASFDKGVLSVSIRKAERAKPKTVAIRS